ncbi:hypothetical protein [Iningainema tapete]|uniref:Uncharacterized protein n=1 Tax=Iningainema tapete BLCC-T55 TaxID=2748662 RepID=A0A8J6XEB2_9CYAN|nr:hypothetical protein [Iningainema tapete]MBD2770967.1 hypothetical protein [Iningainema tapete BLCC-T55]
MANIIKSGVSAVQRFVGNTRKSGSNNSGGGGMDNGIRAFGLQPDQIGILQAYYPAIDWNNLPNLTPDDLALMRDKVNQFQWFIDNLNEIEDLLTTYIDNQVTFNEFKSRLVKHGFKGAEKIEKSVLDVFLSFQGYTRNRKKLAKESDNSIALMDADLESAFEMSDASLETSLRIAAIRKAKKLEELKQRPEQAELLEQINSEQRALKQSIKDRIKYGTAGNPRAAVTTGATSTASSTASSSNKRGGFGTVFDFFKGK